jgi:hypothetical protein
MEDNVDALSGETPRSVGQLWHRLSFFDAPSGVWFSHDHPPRAARPATLRKGNYAKAAGPMQPCAPGLQRLRRGCPSPSSRSRNYETRTTRQCKLNRETLHNYGRSRVAPSLRVFSNSLFLYLYFTMRFFGVFGHGSPASWFPTYVWILPCAILSLSCAVTSTR